MPQLPLAPRSRSIGMSRPDHVAATRSMKNRYRLFRKSSRTMSSRLPLRPGVHLLRQLPPTPPLQRPLRLPTQLLLSMRSQSIPHKVRNVLLPPRTPLSLADTVLTCLGRLTTRNALSDLASHPTQTTNTFHHLVYEGLPLPIPITPGNTGPRQLIARDTPRGGSEADFLPSCEPAELSLR